MTLTKECLAAAEYEQLARFGLLDQLVATRVVAGIRSRNPLRWRIFKPLAIARVEGTSRVSGTRGRALIAGNDSALVYYARQIFAGRPAVTVLRRVLPMRLPRWLSMLDKGADLIIAQVASSLSRLFDDRYITVPEWVRLEVPTPETLEDVLRRAALKEDLRRMRRDGYQVHRADPSRLEHFYRHMHVPLIHQRYGDRGGWIDSFYEMRRGLNHGGLYWATRNGKPIAGVVVDWDHTRLRAKYLGCLPEHFKDFRNGACAALYMDNIRLAMEIGVEKIDFGLARGSLDDGLLRYKKKWGSEITGTHGNDYSCMLRVDRFSPLLTDFLSSHSVLFRDHGTFSNLTALGQAAAPDEVEKRARQHLGIAGVERAYVLDPFLRIEPGAMLPATFRFENAARFRELLATQDLQSG